MKSWSCCHHNRPLSPWPASHNPRRDFSVVFIMTEYVLAPQHQSLGRIIQREGVSRTRTHTVRFLLMWSSGRKAFVETSARSTLSPSQVVCRDGLRALWLAGTYSRWVWQGRGSHESKSNKDSQSIYIHIYITSILCNLTNSNLTLLMSELLAFGKELNNGGHCCVIYRPGLKKNVGTFLACISLLTTYLLAVLALSPFY